LTDPDNFKELNENQLQEINGGGIGTLIAGGVVGLGLLCVGIGGYIGYKDAESEDKGSD